MCAFLLPVASFAAGKGSRSAPPPPAVNRVTGIRYWSTGNVTRVAIEVSGAFRYTADRISNPERLFFDLRNTKPDMGGMGSTHVIPVSDSQLGQIRMAENQPGVTRIVLDLLRPVGVTTSQLTGPNRLVVELRAHDTEPAPTLPAEVTVSKVLPGSNRKPLKDADVPLSRDMESADYARPEPVAPAPKPEVVAHKAPKPTPKRFLLPAVPPLAVASEPYIAAAPPVLMAMAKPLRAPALPPVAFAHLPPPEVRRSKPEPLPEPVDPPAPAPSASVGPTPVPAESRDSSLTRLLGLKLGRIVLDAGHGGQDQGTHGRSGLLEKDLVLDVAHRLGEILTERMGAEVVYTRSNDTFVPLEERTNIANQKKADLFLSIHANSSPYRAAAGIETYVLNFTPSKGANEVAARENAASSSNMHELRSLVEKIASNDKAAESRAFATRLQSSLAALSVKTVDEARNRGIKTAPFVVLIGAGMPSVLVEIGFLTNPDEEAMLRKPEYREKIAEALYKGIVSYSETLSRFDVAQKH